MGRGWSLRGIGGSAWGQGGLPKERTFFFGGEASAYSPTKDRTHAPCNGSTDS